MKTNQNKRIKQSLFIGFADSNLENIGMCINCFRIGFAEIIVKNRPSTEEESVVIHGTIPIMP